MYAIWNGKEEEGVFFHNCSFMVWLIEPTLRERWIGSLGTRSFHESSPFLFFIYYMLSRLLVCWA